MLAPLSPAVAGDAGLPPVRDALRDLERASPSADAAAVPRLRSEAARLRQRLDASGPVGGDTRTRLNAQDRALRRAPGDGLSEPILADPAPYPRRSRIITPALPEIDLPQVPPPDSE